MCVCIVGGGCGETCVSLQVIFARWKRMVVVSSCIVAAAALLLPLPCGHRPACLRLRPHHPILTGGTTNYLITHHVQTPFVVSRDT